MAALGRNIAPSLVACLVVSASARLAGLGLGFAAVAVAGASHRWYGWEAS